MEKEILLIDIDDNLFHKIHDRFCKSSYLHLALSHETALQYIMRFHFALIIACLNPSVPTELLFLENLRSARTTPILVLSDEYATSSKISALQKGADDYLSKPCEIEEIFACAQALMRRYLELGKAEYSNEIIRCGKELIINIPCRLVKLNGTRIDLTRKEFDLLCLMIQNRGRVLSRDQICSHIWREESGSNIDCNVNYHIRMIRNKLGSFADKHIETVWGIGYRFVD